MQIDPHFIFNNLSILLDLVETGDATAPIYIKCLSKVYRHIVANVDKNLSSVADELSSLEAYIFLLKIRFEDAIQVEVQVQDAIRERQIPPLYCRCYWKMPSSTIKCRKKHRYSSVYIPTGINW